MTKQTLTNTTDSVKQSFPALLFPARSAVSIPINFLTVGAIIRLSEIERLKTPEGGYGECVLDADAETAAKFTCADCLCRLNYIGLFNRERERSFAVCPKCQRGMEF